MAWNEHMRGTVLCLESDALRSWLRQGTDATTDRRLRTAFNWLTSTYYGEVHRVLLPTDGCLFLKNFQ